MEDLLFKHAKRNISDITYNFLLDEETEQLLLSRKDPTTSSVSVQDLMKVRKPTFFGWFFSFPQLVDFKVSVCEWVHVCVILFVVVTLSVLVCFLVKEYYRQMIKLKYWLTR